MTSKTVVYGGGFYLFPPDGAGRRVIGVARLISHAGYKVVLCPANGKSLYGEVLTDGCEYEEDRGWKQISFSQQSKIVDNATKKYNPCAVIVYNPVNIVAIRARISAFTSGAKFILDVTEWYQYSHFTSFKWRLEIFLRMNVVYRFFNRAICGSDYLSERFGRKVSVVIHPIPEMTLAEAAHAPPLAPQPLKVAYVGFPGLRKDKIAELIELLDAVARDVAFPMEIHVAGPDRAVVESVSVSSPNCRVIAYGKIEKRRVLELYALCHLTAVIRDNARYEWAGFPIKAIESWMSGIPVIVMSQTRFAWTATTYGATIVIDEDDPVGSLRRGLTDIYDNASAYRSKSLASLNVARDRHIEDVYRERIARVLA